jgi:dTDP-D-glucose 4,6-dehydratase
MSANDYQEINLIKRNCEVQSNDAFKRTLLRIPIQITHCSNTYPPYRSK